MRKMPIIIALLCYFSAQAQGDYQDSLTRYIKRYINDHEVVKGNDRNYLRFYPINEKFRVTASYAKPSNDKWFSMATSGPTKQIFRTYGMLTFTINDTVVRLPIYQSQDLLNNERYKNHLFLPFTDNTTGEETYSSGRYLDLEIGDIINNRVVLDFNKAYNPYCAYVSDRYNCPIPPKANNLPVSIRAGEMNYGKTH